ncbi:MAG: hypothetical protein OM95_10925 [Bdellovibrio sp. ArHS]|uniref:peptidoglycan editing factor PgeF n=1 Tax=Bdellovibrio sp. ArHS TaxID=1569284 RepID=UPI00058345F6|nr:peptidoglycan editing factor PgeF [Bdellovibrio sp. ArHS]KHD88031.1 MAG: hypothetical protein OM95_10925 [Bdellovibrio sp. ArHS]
MNLEQTELGYEVRLPHFTIFLGGVNAQLPQLKSFYPDYTFVRVKQIHSDAVVESRDGHLDYQIIADAHYTKEKNLALCVITADCVPALIYDATTDLIAGIHAGWRGVASKIIPKTIEKLVAEGAKPENLHVVIGPHIQKPSFEVGTDVRDQILSSLGPLSPADRAQYFEALPENKSLVDLNQVVRTQLQQAGILPDQVFLLHINTVTDSRFHSYRRDKEKSGRQISFICRTS